jgi:hypothetical protein
VCIYSYTDSGFRALAIEALFGSYTGFPIETFPVGLGRRRLFRAEQRWVFWEDGQISARLYGNFRHCAGYERDHVYWRFDFDIDTAGNNLALEYNTYTPNLGWGIGWQPITVESSRLRNPGSGRTWRVLNRSSGRGYDIIRSAADGTGANDPFSNRDLWFVRYHYLEDRNGNQGTAYGDDLHAFVDGESLNGRDVVVWYCSHREPHWLARPGPVLMPVGNWT